ncbi:MAG: SAM-dependent methyltransferase [Candidatus Promineifilaceae bacterium]|jgi:SAM-dependent methyltransferase
MRKKMKALRQREAFNPVFWGLFTTPSYLSRRGLRKGIAHYASQCKGRVLDFGCGAKPYRSLFDVDEYIGIDTQNSGHDHTDETVDVYYDGQRLPFDNDAFDVVFTSQVLEHVADIDMSMSEIVRVMKPGATLLATLPFTWGEHEQPYDFRRYSTFGIKALCSQYGLVDVEVQRSTASIAALCQQWNTYAERNLLPRNPIARLLLAQLLITPVTLLGLLLSVPLPDNGEIYIDNIVFGRKPT